MVVTRITPANVFFATSLLWLAVGPLISLVCVFVHAVRCCQNKVSSLRKLLLTSMCCFLFTFHTTITLQAFQMFVCRPVDLKSIEYRLSADAAVECYTFSHWLYIFTVGIPLLVCYVIFPPFVALWYLRQNKPDEP